MLKPEIARAVMLLAGLANMGLRCPDCPFATTDLLGYADHLAETGHGRRGADTKGGEG